MGSFRFLFLADPQFGCYAAFSGMSERRLAVFAEHGMQVRSGPSTTGWEWDAARYRDAVTEGLAWDPDLVVIGGDMVNDLSSAGQIDDFTRLTRGWGDVEVRFAPGNHDIAHDARVPTTGSVAAFRAAFGDDGAAFERGGVSFVIVNTVLLDQPAELEGDADAHLDFIGGALAAAATRPGPTVVCGHHPLFVDDPDEEDSYWSVARPRRREVLALFDRHPPDLVLSGHLHRGAHARYGDVELVTAPAVGFPLGDDPSGFLVVDVDVGAGTLTHDFVALRDQGWG